jgi:hypothetical protein
MSLGHGPCNVAPPVSKRPQKNHTTIHKSRRSARVTEPPVSNKASPSIDAKAPLTQHQQHTTTRATDHWWWRSCCGLSRHPCGLCGLFTIFLTQKTTFYDSATEESVLHPKNQLQKPNNRSTNICATPDYSLVSSLRQTPERGGAHVS